MSMAEEDCNAAKSDECTTSSSTTTPISLGVVSVREYLLQTLTTTPFVTYSVTKINIVATFLGIPMRSAVTPEEFVLSSTAVLVTLLGYYVLFGKRHRRKRKVLAEELVAAQRQVHVLEEKLLIAKREDIIATTPNRRSSSEKSQPREIRIFMDGAFDVMHYGHMNAFRLGKSLGTYLIVGVNSDESITKCKGPPLMNDKERLTMVEGCKFVNDVVPNCPYIMTPEYLDYIFTTYDVDYVVHGDDPCIVDGKDVYASAKRRGRYRSIPRTEGVSTTDIVGRMLLMTKEHHLRKSKSTGGTANQDDSDSDNEIHNEENGDGDDISVMTAANLTVDSHASLGVPLGHHSKFLTTSMMLRLFSAGVKHPEEGMRVIYVDGAWDMFHCGHVDFLKEAKKRGDYLIVGIHGDSVVNKRRGGNLPLMNLHERVLSVLGCKYMDDVLIDAPLDISSDMIASLKITEVVHGTESDGYEECETSNDRYRFPKEMGIFTTIQSPNDFKLDNILSRIQKKQDHFKAKIDKKKKAEREWFDNKHYQNGGADSNGVKK